jgi:MFS family permease
MSTSKTLIMFRIVLLAFILFYSTISNGVFDPFLPDMMIEYKVANNKSESGKAASWLYIAFYLGRFISSAPWGAFIDKYGRKPGLIFSITVIAIFPVLFAMAPNYYLAVFMRFLVGLLNGVSIIGKVMSTEVCTEEYKSWSISVTNTIWALGLTCGPLIGAVFYNMIPSFPLFSTGLFTSLFGILLLVLSSIYFEETLEKTITPMRMEKMGQEDQEEEEEGNNIIEMGKEVVGDATEMRKIVRTDETTFTKEEPSPGLKIFSIYTPNMLKLILIFSFNTFSAAVFVGLIPFWIASKYQDGGLNFQYNDISDIFLYLTPFQLILQLFLYPLIQKKRGDYWLITYGHYAQIPLYFFLPFAHNFGEGSYMIQKLWIIFWFFVRNIASFMNFAALQSFTNDITTTEIRGKVNGVKSAFSSMMQMAGPILGQWMLSWSETNGLSYPFDYHFVFLIMCILSFFIILLIRSLKFVGHPTSTQLAL